MGDFAGLVYFALFALYLLLLAKYNIVCLHHIFYVLKGECTT